MKAMKKIVSLVVTAAMLAVSAVVALAAEEPVLSDTTRVNVDNTSSTVYAKPASTEYHNKSDYSLHYYTDGEWYEAYQNFAEPLEAGKYVLTFNAKVLQGNIWMRMDWDETDEDNNPLEDGWIYTGSEGEALSDGWVKYQKTLTLLGNEQKMIIHLNGGVTDVYIDDVSLVKEGETENLITDGGFNNVAVIDGTTAFSGTTASLSNSEKCYIEPNLDGTVADNTYSLHMYTEGDWLEIGQDYTEALAAGNYTLTWYAKGNGKIWFYSNWGAGEGGNPGEFAATHAVDLAVEQPDGWTKYTKNIYIDGVGDTSFLFHGDGAVDLYLDDISLVDANGKNYIIDGGFGEVTIPGQEPDEPVEPDVRYEISEPIVKGLTADGKIQAGMLEISVNVKNHKMGNNFRPMMIAALYDGPALKTMTFLQQNVVETADEEIVPANEYFITLNVPEVTSTSDYKIKLMSWSGFGALNPLKGVYVID